MDDAERRKRLAEHFRDSTNWQNILDDEPSHGKFRECYCCENQTKGDLCSACLKVTADALEGGKCSIGKPYLAPPVRIEPDAEPVESEERT